MNNWEIFKRLIEELMASDCKYNNELKNFLKYLSDRMLEDKVFDLSISDIDNYFIYATDSKIGSLPTLTTHIVALKNLFNYLISKNLNFRELYAHINTSAFKDNLSRIVADSFKKPIIPETLLKSTLYKMDKYIEKGFKYSIPNNKKRFHEAMIARLYAKLSLIIPLKVNEMLDLKLGNIKDINTRTIEYNGISIKISNSLRNQIIDTVEYTEKTYKSFYSQDDKLFIFLYKAINREASTSSIRDSFVKTYKEIEVPEMLKQRHDGKKYKYIYPAESYKTTAILEMLNNGVNIVYLKQLTGLDVGTLLSNYNFNSENQIIDKVSTNINNGINNTNYYTYI